MSISGMQLASKKRSVKNVQARKDRQELTADARRIGATSRCRSRTLPRPTRRPSGVWANNDVCLGRHFPRTAFLFRKHTFFDGMDVRPVMLGATCYIASASDGAPCKRLGRFCTSWEAQPPPRPFQKLAGIARRQHHLNSCQTSNIIEQVQLQLRRAFRCPCSCVVNERKTDATVRRWSDGAGVLNKERKVAPVKQKSSRSGFVTKLQGGVVFLRGITLDHPQPATNVPMHASGIKRGLILKIGGARLHPPSPFPPVWSLQTSKARRAANALRLR